MKSFPGLRILVLTISVLLYACGSTSRDTLVTVYPKMGIGEKMYMFKVPYSGKNELMDSAIVTKNDDPIRFTLPGNEQGMYLITSSFNDYQVSFIRDAPMINIHADYFARTSSSDSRATISLLKFKQAQDALANRRNPAYFNNAINYADTVKSPAAFALIYDQVDFGKDYAGLKKFITRAVKRFPTYPPVKEIEQRALNFIKIMEEEYHIGDTLPFISLPDRNGDQYSTSALKGKFYFIDFWSTFSPASLACTTIKKEIRSAYSKRELDMVSVALDPEISEWKRYVDSQHLEWRQLIDQKVWEGTAIRTLKFDSIPANFLIAPDGKIVAKSIPSDSLLSLIGRYVRQHTGLHPQ